MINTKNRIIPYGKQSVSPEDIQAVIDVLHSDWWTQGPAVSAFEKEFAQYIHAPNAVAVCNGTAALHLAVMALGIQPGQKVITTPITFAASGNCVLYCGGEVEFVDIVPETGLIDINQVIQKITTTPKGTYAGVIPVAFAGNPVILDQLYQVTQEYGMWILEDACHAPGASWMDPNGKKVYCGSGEYVDASIFSFHPVKHIATGEGGMITSKRTEVIQKVQVLRTHGITKDPNLMHQNHGGWYMEMQELGYNYRMPDLCAALGVTQTQQAPEHFQRRQEIAKRYESAFRGTKIRTLQNTKGGVNAYHLYVIQVENRKEVYDALREKGILAQVHYIPMHTMPFYKKRYPGVSLPFAEKYYSICLSIPMYHGLSDEDQSYVIDCIKNICA